MEISPHTGLRPEDEQMIAAFMARLATSPVRVSPAIPSAGLAWLKAELLRRWDAERRVMLPLDLMEPIQIAAGIGAAAALFIWTLPSLFRAFMP